MSGSIVRSPEKSQNENVQELEPRDQSGDQYHLSGSSIESSLQNTSLNWQLMNVSPLRREAAKDR
jgi:hypothetical protein